MKQPKVPCYKCETRSAECHATCERYAEYCKLQHEWREASWAERKGTVDALAYLVALRIKNRDYSNKEKQRRGLK